MKMQLLKFPKIEVKNMSMICMLIDHLGRSMHISLAMNVVEKATLLFTVLLTLNIFPLRKFGFLKVPIF